MREMIGIKQHKIFKVAKYSINLIRRSSTNMSAKLFKILSITKKYTPSPRKAEVNATTPKKVINIFFPTSSSVPCISFVTTNATSDQF